MRRRAALLRVTTNPYVCVFVCAVCDLQSSQTTMQSQLERKQTVLAEAQRRLAHQSATLEELLIRKQAVSAGMRQGDGGSVTTVGEQLMSAQQRAGACESGAGQPCRVVWEAPASLLTTVPPFPPPPPQRSTAATFASRTCRAQLQRRRRS